MKFSHALTNLNLLSMRSVHNLRLHRNQPGWTERTATKQPVQALQEAAPDRERQYRELQSIIAQANQRTLADSRPADSKQTQKPANLLAASQQSTDNAATAVPTNPSTGVAAEAPAPQESNRPPKVSAQSLFSQRPGPPSTLPTSKSKTDTPGTGVLSSDSQSATHNKDEEQQQPQKEQSAVDNDTPTEESSPADTPNESPETQATDTVVASSPEPASESIQDVDLAAADIPTLQNMEKAACERVAFHETRLASARGASDAYQEAPQKNARWPVTRHSASLACSRSGNGKLLTDQTCSQLALSAPDCVKPPDQCHFCCCLPHRCAKRKAAACQGNTPPNLTYGRVPT